MKLVLVAAFSATLLSACSSNLEVRNGPQEIHPSSYLNTGPVSQATPARTDACGASQLQHLVGGPSKATHSLKIPGDSRHYGRSEKVATDTPSRLNFVHSGTDIESVTNPKSKVIRVFCG
ncbi:hypothetical protein GGR95_001532 [Sulfitobacter undariae]|uniref:Peptidase inhibitor I78 family protein n=1 Tax=Sulfitobacter undariae TaxID=1563671 RepID=A0A7W6GZG6_9RHOB|nr:hypothetical protein [Sulfitobacter undariae]